MRGRGTVAGALVLGLIFLSAGVVLLAWNPTPSSAQVPVAIAIDMDITGNNARLSAGANVQDCREIDSGGTNTIQLDVLLPAPLSGARQPPESPTVATECHRR